MTSLICHHLPAPQELEHWVDSIWMVENPSEQDKPIIVLPDGRIDIHFGSSRSNSFHTALAGIDTQASYTNIAAGSRFCGIGLHLMAVESVLKIPLGHLLDQRLLLAEGFWGIQDKDICDFETFSTKVLNELTRLDFTVEDTRKLKIFTALQQTQGHISVSELAELSHWSSRQINRYFNKWFGLSLKAYSSILRFRASFSHLKTGKLFPASDFADQSHFIKEIKKYSGHTPRELHNNQDDRFIQLSFAHQD